MSNYGWKDLRLMVMVTGDQWRDIKSYIDEQSNPKLKAMVEEWHPKGAEWTQKIPVGTKEWDGQHSLSGLFDDTATVGPDAIFNNNDNNIGLVAQIAESFDAGATWRVYYVIIMDYAHEPQQKGKTRFTVNLDPYGEPYYRTTTPSGSSFYTADE